MSVAALWFGKILGNPFRQEGAGVLDETELLVDLQGCGILAHDFQMQGANSSRARGFFHEFQRLPSPAASAIFLEQVEFVDEGIAAEPFQAVAKA